MSPKVYGLIVPVPPSANRWWRRAGTHMHKSDEARAYQQQVALRAKSLGICPIRRPSLVAISLIWYRERKAGDLDKRVGILLDALQGTAYESDAQIIEIHAKRVDGTAEPRVEVTIYEVPATMTSAHRHGHTVENGRG